MKKIIFTLIVCTLASLSVEAQSRLEGLWKGTITVGGLEAAEKLPFELYLKKEGTKLVGRSYIYLKGKQVVEMEVKGTMYGDLSIYLRDTDFIPFPESDYKPAFSRKYQLMYLPSIWETKMEGFWQEITPQNFSEKRALGRIQLKKMKDRKRA